MESFNWPGHAPRAMLLRFARKAFVTSLEYSSTQIPSPTNLVIIGSHGFGQEQNNILNCYVAGTKTFFGEQSLAVARIPLRRVELEFGTSALLLSDTTSFHNNDFDAAEASTRLDQFE